MRPRSHPGRYSPTYRFIVICQSIVRQALICALTACAGYQRARAGGGRSGRNPEFAMDHKFAILRAREGFLVSGRSYRLPPHQHQVRFLTCDHYVIEETAWFWITRRVNCSETTRATREKVHRRRFRRCWSGRYATNRFINRLPVWQTVLCKQ